MKFAHCFRIVFIIGEYTDIFLRERGVVCLELVSMVRFSMGKKISRGERKFNTEGIS